MSSVRISLARARELTQRTEPCPVRLSCAHSSRLLLASHHARLIASRKTPATPKATTMGTRASDAAPLQYVSMRVNGRGPTKSDLERLTLARARTGRTTGGGGVRAGTEETDQQPAAAAHNDERVSERSERNRSSWARVEGEKGNQRTRHHRVKYACRLEIVLTATAGLMLLARGETSNARCGTRKVAVGHMSRTYEHPNREHIDTAVDSAVLHVVTMHMCDRSCGKRSV